MLLSLNPLDLKLQERKGGKVAARWLVLKNQIERPISPKIIGMHHAQAMAPRLIVPREGIRIFDLRKTLLENVNALGPKLHRSYPVSKDGTAAHITGYIRVRELFVQNLHTPAADWTTLVRPVLHIDSKASLTQLLTLFQEKNEIASLVDDAAGNVTGWITMDDVMKVLMGARV